MTLCKTVFATAIALASVNIAQAAVVNGSIFQQIGGTTNTNGTSIDVYNITLAANGYLEIDMLANESFTGSLSVHPSGLIDLNGDGEYTTMDGHMRLYQGALEVGIADDSSTYTAPGNSNGWADGSISGRDSYMLLSLNAGSYTLAVGDYNMTAADVLAGFNPGDTLGSNQDHVDYRLSINAYDNYDFDDNGNPVIGNAIGVSVSQVPVPAAAWLFGSAMMGFGAISRRKRA